MPHGLPTSANRQLLDFHSIPHARQFGEHACLEQELEAGEGGGSSPPHWAFQAFFVLEHFQFFFYSKLFCCDMTFSN